jgi:hypothetical protein
VEGGGAGEEGSRLHRHLLMQLKRTIVNVAGMIDVALLSQVRGLECSAIHVLVPATICELVLLLKLLFQVRMPQYFEQRFEREGYRNRGDVQCKTGSLSQALTGGGQEPPLVHQGPPLCSAVIATRELLPLCEQI